jgi:hypothetical protein
VLRKYDKKPLDIPVTARQFARGALDEKGLQLVKVESTDAGDHYDQQAKAVRLVRHRIDGKSLTALTTAAHEVAHALQDASDYPPFVWRTHLAQVAQIAGQLGAIILVAAPLLSLSTQRPIPFRTMGSAIFGVMGAGLTAQLAALPPELDASFNRAIPMLRSSKVSGRDLKNARLILAACSSTYVAAPLISILNFWPWFITGITTRQHRTLAARPDRAASKPIDTQQCGRGMKSTARSMLGPIFRQFGRPMSRRCFRLSNWSGKAAGTPSRPGSQTSCSATEYFSRNTH